MAVGGVFIAQQLQESTKRTLEGVPHERTASKLTCTCVKVPCPVVSNGNTRRNVIQKVSLTVSALPGPHKDHAVEELHERRIANLLAMLPLDFAGIVAASAVFSISLPEMHEISYGIQPVELSRRPRACQDCE
jgi:hypothetical protein